MLTKRLIIICTFILLFLSHSYSTVYSEIKLPFEMSIDNYVCVDNYIWYSMSFYRSNNNNKCIGRYHLQSKENDLYGFNKSSLSVEGWKSVKKIAATDSVNAMFLQDDGNLFKFNGKEWDSIQGQFIELTNDASGKIWCLSSKSISCYQNGSLISEVSCDSIGLSGSVKSIATDSLDNVWALSSNSIVKYNGTKWEFMFNDSAINFNNIERLSSGSICFYSSSNHKYYRFINDKIELLANSVKPVDMYHELITDSNGYKWKTNTSPEYDGLVLNLNNGITEIDFQNSKSHGWKNWPEQLFYIYAQPLAVHKKEVFINNRNGFYRFSGDTSNLFWEWIPVNISDYPTPDYRYSQLIPGHDTSMYIFMTISGGYNVYKYKADKLESLPAFNHVTNANAIEDRNGVLWCATSKESSSLNYLYCLENSMWIKANSIYINKYVDMCEDNNGRMMIYGYASPDSNKQIILRQETAGSWEKYECFNSSNSNLPKTATQMISLSNGELWFPTNEEGVATTRDLFKFTYFDTSNSILNSMRIDKLTAAKDKITISIMDFPVSTSMYNYADSQWVRIQSPCDECNRIPSLFYDSKGRLWYYSSAYLQNNSSFGGRQILAYKDGDTWYKEDSINTHIQVEEDLSQTIWVSSNTGIYKLSSLTSTPYSSVSSAVQHKNKFDFSYCGQGKSLINIHLDKPSNISLDIFNLQGKTVQTLKKGFLGKGIHKFDCNLQSMKGIFFVRLKTDDAVYTSRLDTF